MELGLPPRSTRHCFLEQSRESKRLSHEISKTGKTCLEGQYFENTRIRTLRGKIFSRASELSELYQSSVDLPRGNMDMVVDLKDLHEVQVKESEQLMVESRDMMTSPSVKECMGSLRAKDLIYGSQAYLLLRRNVYPML